MSFKPVNADHAIEAVSFSLLLKNAVDPAALNAIQANHRLWRAELPAVNVPQVLHMQMDPGGSAPRARTDRGIEFSFLRPDGTPAWTLRAIGHEITVECSRYTRWAKIWGRTLNYFSTVLRVLAGTQREQAAVGMSLSIVDKFVSNADPYNLESLLLKNVYIAEKIFSGGSTWHNHLGWFESFDLGSVLHNLNIDARREPIPGFDGQVSSIVIAIHHLLQMRLIQSMSLSEVCAPEGASPFSNAMEFMHKRNKQVVGELLAPGMRARIGLEVTS